MTTVKELIEYLQTLPEETEVSVVEGVVEGVEGAYSYSTQEVPLNLDTYEGNVDYKDFTDNQFVPEGHELHNRKFLTLGDV